MMFTEDSAVPAAALPVAEFRDHLRLGTGFAHGGAQAAAEMAAESAALEGYLRAAIAAIEGRTTKALIARGFTLVLDVWRRDPVQPLPVAPVSTVTGMVTVGRDGTRTAIDPSRYRLVRDMSRPRIETEAMLPGIPVGGYVEIGLVAGFGAWAEVPADLRQAVMLLAASYYEMRHEGGAQGGAGTAMPFGVGALIERWRTVRLLGGQA